MHDSAEPAHVNFRRRVLARDFPPAVAEISPEDAGLSSSELVDLFDSQAKSRHLDLTARWLRARNQGFYTIGSAGHEGNAVFGKAFRATDMAFLHYRDGALMIQRAKQDPGEDTVRDILLSLVAAATDPVSGGRHKILGSKALLVPPQTSTVASHLPKAVGAAHAIGLARVLKDVDTVLPADSVVLCSFGDASVNHSTAQGAINTAGWAAYQNSPMPVVFICEDNGIGISTPTPSGWIRASLAGRAGLHYLYCDGLDVLDAWRTAVAAVHYARQNRKPVFLHVRMIRLMGHAGSDMEAAYRSAEDLAWAESQDPLLHTARILVEHDILSPAAVCDLYRGIEAEITALAERVVAEPKLASAAAIMAPIIPPPRTPVPAPTPVEARREDLFAREWNVMAKPRTMAHLLNYALADILLQYPETILFGEDVGRKGGVYGITDGLYRKFGAARVTDTLLDEQSILGMAIGLGLNGFIPIPEIQFLAYVHNAEDQIRGEAATLSFFSNGRYANPMIIRVPGLAYQKGFGGHFHNDNSLAVFRDIPGLVIACPSNGADAVRMLRACLRLAREEGRVVVFIEPIALYHTADLYEPGDGLWQSIYLAPENAVEMPPGEISVRGEGEDLAIVSYANGFYLSLKAARILRDNHGMDCRVIDLRWLAPLNQSALLEAVAPCRAVLVVDECRRTGSLSEALMTLFAEHAPDQRRARLTAEDSFIPLGAAAELVLPDVAGIVREVLALRQKVIP
jgi:2-oxoisovalerate dehydrogenase E1 component